MAARPSLSCITRGELRAETVEWLLREYTALAPHVEVQITSTPYGIQHNRNEATLRFLRSQCTHLFWLDSDCIPKPGTVSRLLAYDLPFVCAPGNQLVNGEVGPMAVDWSGEGYVQHRPMEGLQRCDATGTAGMLIRRDVLEAMTPPWWEFRYDDTGRLVRGEDFTFCERLKEMGYDVVADFELVQRHRVGVVV